MKYFLPILIFLSLAYSQDSTTVAIITTDGTEIIGKIVEESDIEYQIKTPAGLTVIVPKESVYSIVPFIGTVKEGRLFRPDPNKSLYIFSPSAYPIGKDRKYCRDFCIIFPSFNFGITDIFSSQVGIFWLPGLDVDKIPLIGSLKASIYQYNKIALAAGAMYVKFPDLETQTTHNSDGSTTTKNIGKSAGFLFVTSTYGTHLSHASVSLGWGYSNFTDDWEIMDKPIIVLAGNLRISPSFALVTENWILPEVDSDFSPFSLSVRFLGKSIATDLGIIFTPELFSEGLPLPLINFTYHF